MLGRLIFYFLFGILLFPFTFNRLHSSEWPAVLSESDKPIILNLIRSTSKGGRSREAAEYQLTRTLHQHVLRDALLLYQNEMNPALVKFTYASFTFDKPGEDAGFGLHVVKQFKTDKKLILVNELWPIENGRLQLPDEIRFRTQAFGSVSESTGSAADDENMVGARFRLAWDDRDKPEIFFEPIFEEDDRSIPRRVPVSNLHCVACHSGNHSFAREFMSEGRPLDRRQNVQPDYFDKPLAQSKGYIQLRTFLKRAAFRRVIDFKALETIFITNGRKNLALPTLSLALREMIETKKFSTLGYASVYGSGSGPGYFTYNKMIYRDAIRDIEEQSFGRGRWWEDNQASIFLFRPESESESFL